jgi:hypothetical protein
VTPVLQRARSIRSPGKARTFGGIRTCGFRTKHEVNGPLTALIGVTTFLMCSNLFEPTVSHQHGCCFAHPRNTSKRADTARYAAWNTRLVSAASRSTPGKVTPVQGVQKCAQRALVNLEADTPRRRQRVGRDSRGPSRESKRQTCSGERNQPNSEGKHMVVMQHLVLTTEPHKCFKTVLVIDIDRLQTSGRGSCSRNGSGCTCSALT